MDMENGPMRQLFVKDGTSSQRMALSNGYNPYIQNQDFENSADSNSDYVLASESRLSRQRTEMNFDPILPYPAERVWIH